MNAFSHGKKNESQGNREQEGEEGRLAKPLNLTSRRVPLCISNVILKDPFGKKESFVPPPAYADWFSFNAVRR